MFPTFAFSAACYAHVSLQWVSSDRVANCPGQFFVDSAYVATRCVLLALHSLLFVDTPVAIEIQIRAICVAQFLHAEPSTSASCETAPLPPHKNDIEPMRITYSSVCLHEVAGGKDWYG